jgi:hypothetical protein
MNDSLAKQFDDRIAAMIARIRDLAAERDAYRRETEAMKSLMETRERDNTRLRTVLTETVRELRQE